MIVKGYHNSVKKYKKKPVIIEAMKYTEDNYDEAITFVGKENCKVIVNRVNRLSMDPNKKEAIVTFFINTLEGNMLVSNGDYIIKGVNGEFYPCKPDIFDKTYEEV